MLRAQVNHSGFTLLETMVGVAIMTVVVLGVLQILGMQLKVSNTARIDADVSNTVFLVNAVLKNSNACKENIINFGSKKISVPIVTAEKLSVPSLNYPLNGGKLISVGGGSSSNAALLKDMHLTNFKLLSNTGGYNIVSSELKLQFQKPNAVGAQVTERKVAVQLRADASGNILDCSGEGTELTEFQLQSICKSVNGTFDFSTKACKLPQPVIPPPQTIVMQMPVPVPIAASGAQPASVNGSNGNGGIGIGGGGSNTASNNGTSNNSGGGGSSSQTIASGGVSGGGGGVGAPTGTILYFENRAPDGAACMRAGSNTCQGKLTTASTCGFDYGCSNNPNESNNGHSLCASLGGSSRETGYWTWECRGIPNKDSGIRGTP